MTDKDLEWVAKLLKLAAERCEDGVDACKRGDFDQLRAALIWAHTAINDAMYCYDDAEEKTE